MKPTTNSGDAPSLPTIAYRFTQLVCEAPPALLKASKTPARGAADAAAILRAVVGDDPREHFIAIYLDAKGKLMGVHVASIGTATASLVHPREVLAPAFTLGPCAAIIVGHNHPSGDTDPSAEDRATTRRLQRACRLMGLELLDHVITGNGESYHSFLEHGCM